jgi:hypothetical protein
MSSVKNLAPFAVLNIGVVTCTKGTKSCRIQSLQFCDEDIHNNLKTEENITMLKLYAHIFV